MNFYDILFARKMANHGDITTEGLSVTENGTYTAPTGKAYTPVVVAVEGYAKKSIPNTPTSIATFNASALPMPSLTVSIEAVQAGSGDPSPTNVRPISGWSAVNVTDCGVNLFNLINGTYTPTNRTITINNQTIHYVNDGAVELNYILRGSINAWKIPKLSAGKTYSFKYTENGNIGFTNVQLEIIHDDGTTTTIDSGSSATLSKDGKVSDLKCDFISTTPNTEADITLQLEVGAQATTYEPYNSTTYTTTLKDGQGNPLTCYGGQLENVNGVQSLTNDTWQGILIPTASQLTVDSDKKHCTIYLSEQANGYTPADTQLKCNKLKPSSYSTAYDNHLHFANALILAVYLEDEVGDTKNAWIQWFTDNQIQICYKLATPQTIPQDNLAIATQDGTNNLWADSGDVLSGEYMEAL